MVSEAARAFLPQAPAEGKCKRSNKIIMVVVVTVTVVVISKSR